MKKLLCNTLIIIIMLGVFCNGYFSFGGLSFSDRFSYAEADNWSSCDTSDLVTAFRYYCKSRNLAIEGSVADALTSFTTTTFNNICSTLGIDPTQLQAELKKTTSANLGLRFLFSQTGITAYNRIFAEFLQNNDLEVGDTVEDKIIKSGEIFTDAEGNTAFIWNMPSLVNNDSTSLKPITYGSKYKYNYLDLMQFSKNSFPITLTFEIYSGQTVRQTVYFNEYYYDSYFNEKLENNIALYSSSSYVVANVFGEYINDALIDGQFILYRVNGGSDIKFGKYTDFSNLQRFPAETWNFISNVTIPEADIDDANVYITTNNNTINNNTYNNNYTIIYNDGDTYYTDDDDEPLPSTPPGGGGGDDPVNPDPDDPYDPNKPFPDTPDNPTPDPGVHGSPGSDGTITIPDFNFDLPDINWSLDGLQNKFPFSLPFDLYNACKLLNAEPQTPELDYTVDLVVYQWPIQMDLHWLDPAARVIRIFELLAFVVGLILITRHLIGG